MKLVNGKFVNDVGEIIPTEHGNLEQIEILKKVEKLKDGIEVSYDTEEIITGEINFRCVCGVKLSVEEEDLQDDDIASFIKATKGKTHCYNCKAEYTISENEKSEFNVIVKLK